jgi:hypothetical protein
VYTRRFTSIPFAHNTGLPPEASAWAGVSVVNLKNNKVLDVGTLPGFWPELTRLYLGEGPRKLFLLVHLCGSS